MKNRSRFTAVITIFVLTSLACNLISNFGKTTEVVPSESPTHTTQKPSAQSTMEIPMESPTLSSPFSTQASSAQTATHECDNPLYPVAVGAEWSYEASGMAADNLTRSILEMTRDGFTDQQLFSDNTLRIGRWECKDGDLISLDLNLSNLAAANAVADGNEIDFEVTEMDGVTLPAVVSEGNSWIHNIKLSGQQNMGGQMMTLKLDISENCMAAGEETVTVPAGTFTAQRVNCTASVLITVNIFGMEIPTRANSSSTSWYAKGVGMIKTESDNGDGTMSSLEMSDFNLP